MTKLSFFPEFIGQQKEKVASGILQYYRSTNGFVVAEPKPDLGDDIWFCRRHDREIFRGQVKSGHTADLQGKYWRRFNFSPQRANLQAAKSKRNYVYLFPIADERFRGFGDGRIDELDGEQIVRFDRERIIACPDYERSSNAKDLTSKASGFHFGCIPSRILADLLGAKRLESDSERNGFWIRIDDVEIPGSDDIAFRYYVGEKSPSRNVSRFFVGIEQALATNSTRQEISRELERLSELAPDLRFGQMITNPTSLAAGPRNETLWNLDDEQLLAAIRQQIADLSVREATPANRA